MSYTIDSTHISYASRFIHQVLDNQFNFYRVEKAIHCTFLALHCKMPLAKCIVDSTLITRYYTSCI